jgi:hypothetical protein
MRQFAHGREVGHLDRRQHQLRHAGGAGTRHHGVAVGVELRGVEVAVRVDPHGRDDACCDGADTGAPVVLP